MATAPPVLTMQPARQPASVWVLAATNIIALLIAVLQGWRLVDLILVYWTQSLIIGASYFCRILALKRFRTSGLKFGDQPADESLRTKLFVAFFFVLHYGFFHAGYLALMKEVAGDVSFDRSVVICSLVFAANHLFSFLHHQRRDRHGTPHIVALMLTPYARIVPMHLTAVLGFTMIFSVFGVFVFGLLKTVADTLMHMLEHGALQHLADGSAKVTTTPNSRRQR